MGWRLVIISSLLDGCVSITPFMLNSVAYALSHSGGWIFLLPWA